MVGRPVIIGVIAVVTTASVFAIVRRQAARSTTAAGFWYEEGSIALPAHPVAALGGPLTAREMETIKQISRTEVERAFAGLRIAITDRRDAFWRVQVVQTLAGSAPTERVPSAGKAIVLGPLGGAAAVNFSLVALKAIDYAPHGASRDMTIEGIARGVGRVAVHEFAHQILGPSSPHSDDENSYEFHSPDRAAQYYGELHWTIAWPPLQQKIGSR